jgi:hypothetical protein
MAHKTAFFEKAVLNVLRATNITAPATIYVMLFTTAPTDAYISGTPTGTEASYTGYARVSCAFAAPSGTPSQVANSADVLFGTKTDAGSVTIVAFGLCDAVSGSTNMFYWNTITNKTINQNDQPKIAAGSLTVSED